MKRDIYNRLLEWKSSGRRKPLLLHGARQTGKTYILRKFGGQEYENVIYCNFEENPELDQFFQPNLEPKRILSDLSLFMNQSIRPELDLVIFDEVQASNGALNSLKYFEEQETSYHIAAAGSLLGIKLSTPGSFPVGKVKFMHLYPMTFPEFLDATEDSRYRRLLESIEAFEPLTEAFHEHLIALLSQYYLIGGMPEVVKYFVETEDAIKAREIQQEIIKSYILDFAKHAPANDIPKLSLIWESIPKHLARENKKFVFSAVKKGARSREYENALIWLEDAGLIYRAFAVETARHPVKHYADTSCFKVYSLDVGLLGAMAGSPVELLVQGDRLFNEYEGSFVENFVAQQLVSLFQPSLYYWRGKGGKAELDFLFEAEGNVYPLEVKSGINPKSKSLRSYDMQYSPARLARTNLLNLKKDGKVCNFPLYAVNLLQRLLTTTT
jgi:predicted AAA+ superfamily ATPase